MLGKLPPPYIGTAIATDVIINSNIGERIDIYHLDTSDHRDIKTLAKIDFVNIFKAVGQYLRLFWLVITKNPDLVYIPSQQTTIGYLRDVPFVIITKMFGKKLLFHLHGGNFKNWYDSSGRFMKFVVRTIHKRVDGQIVLGHNLTGLFDWLIPKEKIYVIPNGHNFEIPVRNRSDEEIRILYLGNFIRTKGILETIQSSLYLADDLSKVRYIFAGSWNDEDTKKEFYQFLENHPEVKVENPGVVVGVDKYQMLVNADIFIFPTYYPNEGHPYVIIEAMAAGLPVISTNHAAISESVIDVVNGFLVEKRNPEAIAQKIRYLISHPEVRKKMSAESIRLYHENFTQEKMISRLEDVFEKVGAIK